jgi:hypothetical protein
MFTTEASILRVRFDPLFCPVLSINLSGPTAMPWGFGFHAPDTPANIHGWSIMVSTQGAWSLAGIQATMPGKSFLFVICL